MMQRVAALSVISMLLLLQPAHSYEMAGSAYRISGDVNSASGTTSSLNFVVSEFFIGHLGGFSAGGLYNITLGSFSPLQVVFIAGSPAFNPAELLVTFWRK